MGKTEFSRRLSQLRTSRGLTQGELADALGMSRSAIGMYEQGRREPDFITADAFADYFSVSLSYLLGSTDDKGTYPRHGEDDELLRAYYGASEETRRIVRYALGMEIVQENQKEVRK